MLLNLIRKIRLKLLLRNEYESVALRRWFADSWRVEVGLYSYGCFDPWRIAGHTRIGRYCSFARTARVVDANHPIAALTTHPYLYEARYGLIPRDVLDPDWLTIEDDVWVGHNATILPGCRFIGRGSIIGAGAIVTSDVPPYSVVLGMPAKVVRRRFDDATIAAVEASRWWEHDKATLGRLLASHGEAFYHPTPDNLAVLARP